MVMAMRPGALLTRSDLEGMPDDGRRYELIDGQLLVSPLARRRHQWVVMRIGARLLAWIEAGGHGRVYPGVNVDLAADTHLEPDVAWSSSQDDSGPGFDRVPELVVEVADRVSPQRSEESPLASSPSTRHIDRGIKRDRYLAAGAREVWLVDLERDVIERHVTDRAGQTVTEHVRGERFTSPLFGDHHFDVDDLLGG